MRFFKVLFLIGCLTCHVTGSREAPPSQDRTSNKDSAKEAQESQSALVVVSAPDLGGHEVAQAVVATRLRVKDPHGYGKVPGYPYLVYGTRYHQEAAKEGAVFVKPVQDLAYTKAVPDKVIYEGVKFVRRPAAKTVEHADSGHHPDRVKPYLGGYRPDNYGVASMVGRSGYASAVYLAPYGLESGLELYGIRSVPWSLSSKWLKRSTPIYSSVYSGPADKNQLAYK